MKSDRFTFLVNEVITKNGAGHKLLAKLVEDKEISKIDEAKILIAVKIAIMSKRVEELCELIE